LQFVLLCTRWRSPLSGGVKVAEVDIYGNDINDVRAVHFRNSDTVEVILMGKKFNVIVWMTQELVKKLNMKVEERE
jgi:hypothetical protein